MDIGEASLEALVGVKTMRCLYRANHDGLPSRQIASRWRTESPFRQDSLQWRECIFPLSDIVKSYI